MKLFAIVYDLKQPGRNYSELYDSIKSLAKEDGWQHHLESSWIIVVGDTVTVDNVATRLRAVMGVTDSLFVVDITDSKYQGWLPKSFWEWMNNRKNDKDIRNPRL